MEQQLLEAQALFLDAIAWSHTRPEKNRNTLQQVFMPALQSVNERFHERARVVTPRKIIGRSFGQDTRAVLILTLDSRPSSSRACGLGIWKKIAPASVNVAFLFYSVFWNIERHSPNLYPLRFLYPEYIQHMLPPIDTHLIYLTPLFRTL